MTSNRDNAIDSDKDKNKDKRNYNLNEILDLVNLKILQILDKNSLTPFIEISKIIGISDATVHLRIKKMQHFGLIKKFTVFLNNYSLGFRILVFIGIKITSNPEQIISRIAKIEEVLEIHEIYNTFDLLIKLRTRSFDQLREIIALKIKNMQGIETDTVLNVIKTHKEEFNCSIENEIENKMIEYF
jgi:Lrp/AsnC family transcriptional regulator for asnA, asnC and gidA